MLSTTLQFGAVKDTTVCCCQRLQFGAINDTTFWCCRRYYSLVLSKTLQFGAVKDTAVWCFPRLYTLVPSKTLQFDAVKVKSQEPLWQEGQSSTHPNFEMKRSSAENWTNVVRIIMGETSPVSAVDNHLLFKACDGGGGFFLACEDLGGRFNDSFPAYASFFFNWRSARAQQFHFLG